MPGHRGALLGARRRVPEGHSDRHGDGGDPRGGGLGAGVPGPAGRQSRVDRARARAHRPARGVGSRRVPLGHPGADAAVRLAQARGAAARGAAPGPRRAGRPARHRPDSGRAVRPKPDSAGTGEGGFDRQSPAPRRGGRFRPRAVQRRFRAAGGRRLRRSSAAPARAGLHAVTSTRTSRFQLAAVLMTLVLLHFYVRPRLFDARLAPDFLLFGLVIFAMRSGPGAGAVAGLPGRPGRRTRCRPPGSAPRPSPTRSSATPRRGAERCSSPTTCW